MAAFGRHSEREPMSPKQLPPAPVAGFVLAWEDAVLLAAAVALCGVAEWVIGSEAASWGAVTVCVVTGMQTDRSGHNAKLRGLLRVMGTAAGAVAAAVAGPSWPCMVAWTAALALLRRRLRPADSYFCVVAAITFAIVGLGPSSTQGAIRARGALRLGGVAAGVAAVVLCLAARQVLHEVSSWLPTSRAAATRRRLGGKDSGQHTSSMI